MNIILPRRYRSITNAVPHGASPCTAGSDTERVRTGDWVCGFQAPAGAEWVVFCGSEDRVGGMDLYMSKCDNQKRSFQNNCRMKSFYYLYSKQ